MARMPIRLTVRMTRRAISPRLATSTDSIIVFPARLRGAFEAPPSLLARRCRSSLVSRGGAAPLRLADGSLLKPAGGLLQTAGQALRGDLGQRLDDPRVVLDRGVQAQPLQRRGAAVPVGGSADQVVEGVGGADDPAAYRRLGVMPPVRPALTAHQLGHPVQHAGLADHVRAELGDAPLVL